MVNSWLLPGLAKFFHQLIIIFIFSDSCDFRDDWLTHKHTHKRCFLKQAMTRELYIYVVPSSNNVPEEKKEKLILYAGEVEQFEIHITCSANGASIFILSRSFSALHLISNNVSKFQGTAQLLQVKKFINFYDHNQFLCTICYVF